MRKLDYAMYDADNHYYEPDDCFTRHIEERYKKRTVWVDRANNGRMYVGSERCHFFSVGVGDSVGPPGIMKEFLRGVDDAGGSPSLSPINALQVREFVDRAARLAKMDEQHVEACLMLPTAGVGVEPQLRTPQHREVLYPTLRAFNRWLEEDWGYGADGRIFGAPINSMVDLDEAIRELDRLLAKSARFMIVTAGPIEGRSPGDPCFDPFWARCEESGINVVYHIGRTPFSEIYNTPWGLRPHPPSHRHSLMEYVLSFTDRPVADTMTALIADNVFGRFPRLKVLSVEYGSSWVAPLLTKLDHIARLYSKDMWRFGAPPMKPSDMFRQNVWVAPFFEDDIAQLAEAIGVEHVLHGSDYPHPEGLLWPAEFAEELTELSDDAVRKIMRENLRALVA
ncbi:MAG: amidohydrolase [Deltaproteobacteria bacterium]|nr:amidohydrolase [Deltaproteobacteria bacterium]MBI3388167.1 amidohydrolase [Deltaproteobacteria bacterium]